jgi:hypothetical protein
MGDVNQYRTKFIIALMESTGYYEYIATMPGTPGNLLFKNTETGTEHLISLKVNFEDVQSIIYEYAYNHGKNDMASKLKEQIDIVFEIKNQDSKIKNQES